MNKVVETIKIEKLEGGAFNVILGDRYSDQLGWDEMLGLVSALTIAKEPMCLSWIKTKEEHERELEIIKNMPTEVEFEDILVPESIGIYRYKKEYEHYNISGDLIYIGFNSNKQLLGFCDGIYEVLKNDDAFFDRIDCKLIPCNREDFKAGDTALFCAEISFDIHCLINYCKILSSEQYVVINKTSVVTGVNNQFDWYKVVPA